MIYGMVLESLGLDSACVERPQFSETDNSSTADVTHSWIPLPKGIPQGSNLGPFLFNIFMNNIFFVIDLYNLANYADDNTRCIINCKYNRSSIVFANTRDWTGHKVVHKNIHTNKNT